MEEMRRGCEWGQKRGDTQSTGTGCGRGTKRRGALGRVERLQRAAGLAPVGTSGRSSATNADHPWEIQERRGGAAWRGAAAPPTFQAADPPEARVGEAPRVLLFGGAAPAVGGPLVAGCEVGGVADEGARVQPVVGADGDGHEAEGGEGAHRGQQHLHPLLAPEAPLFVPALQRLQFDHGQPGGRGPPPGQRGRGRAGGWGGVTAQAEEGGLGPWRLGRGGEDEA